MSLRGSGLVVTVAAALLLGAALPRAAAAQSPRVAVTVDYIAGANIYLASGSEHGLVAGDTVTVRAAEDGPELGRFLVLSATAARTVVEFLGPPFPVTRGQTLYLQLGTLGRAAAAPVGAQPEPAVKEPRRRAAALHGRVFLEANAFESTTRWQSNTLEEATRRFATPSLGLRAVASDLPGGVRFTTSLRGTYRYSDPEIVSPAWALQVYQASLAKTTDGAVPLHLEAGRFINPYASFSGLWDGLLLHVGGRGLGAGVAAGFEPQRGDEGVSTTLPKMAGFVTYDAGAGTVRYGTDVSVTHVRPRDGRPDHSYAAWSQYLRVERFRLGSDLQVDRDPEADRFVVTRLNANVAIPLAPGLELRGRVSRFQPYQFWRATNLIGFRRDLAGGGLFFWRSRGSVSADVAAARLDDGTISYTYSGGFTLVRTPIFGLDWSANASYWTQETFTALYGTAGLARTLGLVSTRASYQLYRTSDDAFTSVSHTGDLSLSFAVTRATYATVQGRLQRGDNLWTHGVYLGLWTAF